MRNIREIIQLEQIGVAAQKTLFFEVLLGKSKNTYLYLNPR